MGIEPKERVRRYIVPTLNRAIWTQGAKECYKRGCNCEGCKIQEIMKSQKCLMKMSVIELVRLRGKPFERKESELYYEWKWIINLRL